MHHPPLEDAMHLMDQALALLTRYEQDAGYIPDETELALWHCICQESWRHQAVIQTLYRTMQARHHRTSRL